MAMHSNWFQLQDVGDTSISLLTIKFEMIIKFNEKVEMIYMYYYTMI